MTHFTAAFERAAHRVRTVLVVERLSSLGALALALACAFILMDLLLRLPAPLRALLLAVWAGAVAWTLWRRIRPAWRMRISPVSIALRAEDRMPAMRGRIAAALEFASARRTSGAPESPFEAAVVDGVVPHVSDRDIMGVIDARPCRRRVVRLAAMVLAAIGIAVAAPSTTVVGMQRLFMPWTVAEWPARTGLESRTDVRHHPRGAALPLRVDLTRGDAARERVWVRIRRMNANGLFGAWEESLAVRQSGARFERLVEPGERAVEFQFRTADVSTDVQRVDIVEPPALASARATVTPPSYARDAVPPREQDLGGATGSRGRIADPVVEGSRVTVTMQPSRAASPPDAVSDPDAFAAWVASTFSMKGQDVTPDVRVTDGAAGAPQWEVAWEASRDASLSVTLRDPDGVTNVEPIAVDVSVVADRPPEVVVTEPAADETVLPTAIVPVRVEARDDLAVGALRADVALRETVTQVASSTLTAGQRQARADGALDVGSTGAAPGDVLELSGVASDIRMVGTGADGVRSVPRRLRVISGSQFDEEMRAALAALRQSAIRADERQRALVEREDAPGELVRPQGELSERLAGLERTVTGMRSRLSRNRSGDDALRSVLDAAEDLVAEAAARSNEAREGMQGAAESAQAAQGAERSGDSAGAARAKASSERAVAEARAAQEAVRAELEDLAQLLDRDRDAWAAGRQLEKVTESLAKADAARRAAGARTAGRAREELGAAEVAELDRAAQAAEDAARAAREAMESLAERAERVKSADPVRAEALRAAVRRGEEGSLESRTEQAAQSTRENRMDEASRASAQAAQTVQQMMSELADDERSRTETLRRRLASMLEALEGLLSRAESAQRSTDALAPDAQAAEAEARGAGTLNQQALAVADEGRAGGPSMQRIVRTVERGAESAGRGAVALRRAPPAVADGAGAIARATTLFREARDLARTEERRNEARDRERRVRALAEAYRALADRQEGVVVAVTALAQLDAPAARDRRRIMEARRAGVEQESVRTAARALAEGNEDVRASEVLMNSTDALSDAASRAAADLRDGTARAQTAAECADVLQILRGLAAALAEQAQARNPFEDAQAQGGDQAGGGGGGGEGEPDEPVVPPVAELKVLRAVQQGLAERTRAVGSGDLPAEMLETVARRQSDIAALAEKVREEIERRMKEQRQRAGPSMEQVPEGGSGGAREGQPEGAPEPGDMPDLAPRRAPVPLQRGPAAIAPAMLGLQGAAPPSSGQPSDGPAGGAAASPPPKSLDELLGIGGAKGGSGEQPAGDDAARAAAEAERAARERLAKVLNDDQMRDLMREVVAGMRRSATLLDGKESGTAVQRVQAETIARLDALIESAQQRQQQQRQQQSSSSSSSSSQSQSSGQPQDQRQGQPQGTEDAEREAARRAAEEARRRAEEQARREAGAAGDPQGGTPEVDPAEAAQGGPLEQSEAEWGRLPARTREAVRQGLREKMSTTYRWWTEQYYRRIA
ncbi:MAG: hypothetical protein FGM37_02570, partial [Phycisphaerales bacterium]|nr:hypothetical protein [Phycisphaerales bacterium]